MLILLNILEVTFWFQKCGNPITWPGFFCSAHPSPDSLFLIIWYGSPSLIRPLSTKTTSLIRPDFR